MTPKQKAELRASEIRKKLAALAGADELTDEQRDEITELRSEYQDVETKIQALAISEDEPEEHREATVDGEEKERRELREKIKLGNYVLAALEGRNATGAEAEYNASAGIEAGHFPLDMLAPEPVEQRATTDAVTAVNSTRWVDRLFADTAAMRLGITFDAVSPGQAVYPITTAGGAGAQRAREEAIADADWTIGTENIDPTRMGIRVKFSIEDNARIPGLESALDRDIRMALTESMDRAIFLGDAGATGDSADVAGLTTLAIGESTLTQANKVKAPETLAAFLGMVDGKHAASLGDLNIVSSVGAYRLWAGTIANAAAENQTVAEFLRNAGLSWMARGEIEEATGAGKFGAFVGLARGLEGASAVPVWSSAFMVRDHYTGAASGEVALTLHVLWNFKLVRASNFKRLKFVA